jgi:hypothetical protein
MKRGPASASVMHTEAFLTEIARLERELVSLRSAHATARNDLAVSQRVSAQFAKENERLHDERIQYCSGAERRRKAGRV